MTSRRIKYTIEEVKDFISKEGKGICLSDVYIHNKSPLKWKCGKCEHIFQNSFKNVKYLENWCPCCSGKLNNNICVARKIAEERGGLCLSTVYKNNKTNLTWKCGKCNHIWEARLDRVKTETWCPKCNQSYGEKKISNSLTLLNINYKQECVFDTLKNRRFDFYLHEFGMLIEFDGIQHFQINGIYTPNKDSLEKTQNKDVEKTLFCIRNNIKLLRICYKNINEIDYYISLSLKCNEMLIFSDLEMYSFIIEKIGDIKFLTGVDE